MSLLCHPAALCCFCVTRLSDSCAKFNALKTARIRFDSNSKYQFHKMGCSCSKGLRLLFRQHRYIPKTIPFQPFPSCCVRPLLLFFFNCICPCYARPLSYFHSLSLLLYWFLSFCSRRFPYCFPRPVFFFSFWPCCCTHLSFILQTPFPCCFPHSLVSCSKLSLLLSSPITHVYTHVLIC